MKGDTAETQEAATELKGDTAETQETVTESHAGAESEAEQIISQSLDVEEFLMSLSKEEFASEAVKLSETFFRDILENTDIQNGNYDQIQLSLTDRSGTFRIIVWLDAADRPFSLDDDETGYDLLGRLQIYGTASNSDENMSDRVSLQYKVTAKNPEDVAMKAVYDTVRESAFFTEYGGTDNWDASS